MMLQTLRDKASGWLVTVVLGLLMVPFLFVVDGSYFGGIGVQNVGRVAVPPAWWPSAPSWWPLSYLWNHQEISIEESRRHFEQARMLARQQQGDLFDPREFESTENKRAVLEGLIEQKIVHLAADNAHISVSEQAVNAYIGRLPEFQNGGQFSEERYRLILAQSGYTHAGFKLYVRQNLEQNLMPEVLGRSGFVTASQRNRLLALLGETRDVEFVRLPKPELNIDEQGIDEAHITQWYQSHTQDFIAPESVTIEYVELNESSVPPLLLPDEATLRQRYEQEKIRFITPEQRRASHILIALPANADAKTQADAGVKTAMLADQARLEGADFAALARENSDDPGSSAQGGDLGWVEPGLMVGAFEQALFAMQTGEVSAPVRTEFGFHIIKLHEIQGGEGQSFEQVRDQLAAEQEQADLERALNDLAGHLVDLTDRSPTVLESAAQELGLELRVLGPFTRQNASGIAAHSAVRRAAFSDILIEDGTVSELIEIGPNHTVMLRVRAHTPEHVQPLEHVREHVIAAIAANEASQQAQAQADTFLAQLAEEGQSLAALAQAQNWPLFPMAQLPRNAQILPEEVEQAVFSAAAPEGERPTYGKVKTEDGSYMLFAITQVTPGNVEAMPAQYQERLQAELGQLDGVVAVQTWTQALRSRAQVQVREEQL